MHVYECLRSSLHFIFFTEEREQRANEREREIEGEKKTTTILLHISFSFSFFRWYTLISQNESTIEGLEYVIFNSKEIYLPVQHIDHISDYTYGCPWSIIVSNIRVKDYWLYMSAIWDEWIIKSNLEILNRDAMPVVFTRLPDFFLYTLTFTLFLISLPTTW